VESDAVGVVLQQVVVDRDRLNYDASRNLVELRKRQQAEPKQEDIWGRVDNRAEQNWSKNSMGKKSL
jgi:hypothetical protein